MLFQKCLARIVIFITWLFRLEYSIFTSDRIYEDYFGLLGPRMLIIRKGGGYVLTGVFAVEVVRSLDRKFLSCKVLGLSLDPGDRLIQGPKVYDEYRKLCF